MTEYLMNPLTDVEQSELAQYEQTIRQGLNTFFDVGIALGQIREKRLYRDHHDTFEEYCQERWEMSKTHANRYIASANVMKALKSPPAQMTIDMTPGAVTPIGVSPADVTTEVLPENESQVRPLTKLDPALQRTAWDHVAQAVKAGAKLTASLVEEVVSRLLTPQEPEPQQPEPEPIPDESAPDERQIDIEEAISPAKKDNAEPEESQITPPILQADTETPDTKAIGTNEGEVDWEKEETSPEAEPESETTPEPIKPEAAAILDALEQDRGWVNQIVKQFADSKYWPYDTTDHKLFREVTIRKPTGAKNRWGEDALKRYRLDAVAVIRINAHRYNPIIVGIEVKVDKHDLLHDSKMQEYLDYVDCFYLVTPRTLAVEKRDYRRNHPQKDHIGDLIVEAGRVELHQLAEPLTPDARARQELATELLMKDLWKEAEQKHSQADSFWKKLPIPREHDEDLTAFFRQFSDEELRQNIKLAKRELTHRNRPHMEGDQDILTHHKPHAPKFKGLNEEIEAAERLIADKETAIQEMEKTAAAEPIPTDDDSKIAVLTLHKQGVSVRKIAEHLKLSKSTVDRIIQKAKKEEAT